MNDANGSGIAGRITAALRQDRTGGLLLIAAAAVALLWANSPWSASYDAVREYTFGPSGLHLRLSTEVWAADGLLALFFFLVGNELKQEFVTGPLRDPRQAVVPIVAAACGALVPAAIFLGITAGDPDAGGGWGIPMATDVAFALAVLALVGRHLPPALRTFLLTLAVVDDLIAIVVIAVFYTASIAVAPLLIAVALLGLFGWLQQSRVLDETRVGRWLIYPPLAVAIWTLTHASGIHATIAGVAMGVLMRTRRRPTETLDPSHRMERLLRPLVMGVALPVFALSAAGVSFDGFATIITSPVATGVIVGLIGGKLVGILGGAWLTTRLTRARLDPSLSWMDIVGMCQLAAIGFTVSLLIAELSYPAHETLLAQAKSGVLIGSIAAVGLAVVVLGARNRHYRAQAERPGIAHTGEDA
ncbi:Na+/H+ antiporter NhaA [Stackebrandtia soli]|uniref:Na+/H+ antiporter NhaA n=1 Tax=Stackebrandtia soli TaxID=1892856 RepID=UPI0039EAAB57